MITRKSVANILLLAALTVSLASQSAISLAYQNRGRYNEGIRTEPSTGPAGLELVAALVDYVEPSTTLPSKLCAQFYLPTRDEVDLTIREIEPVYFYWLDKVQPESAWRQGALNRFEWRTSVIAALNWESTPLTLNQLGAIVRVGRLEPGEVEQVAPVALYYSQPPASVNGYRFILRPASQMRLKFQIFKGDNNVPLAAQEFRSVLANEPLETLWKVQNWPDGWFRLVIGGYAVSDNSRVDKVVRFYHARKI